MANFDDENITQLLEQINNAQDKEDIYQKVFPMVYKQLLQIARNIRFRWQGDLTLNTTSLVHEA